MTTTMVCTCGGGPTTEVYHEPYCPLYRVQRAGSVLLAALMSIIANGILLADGATPSDIRLLDKVEAAIRQAGGMS